MTPAQHISADLAAFVDWLVKVRDEDRRVKIALLVRDMVKKAKAV